MGFLGRPPNRPGHAHWSPGSFLCFEEVRHRGPLRISGRFRRKFGAEAKRDRLVRPTWGRAGGRECLFDNISKKQGVNTEAKFKALADKITAATQTSNPAAAVPPE